ncbi:hypothetical protein HELRODRAFT_182655 [Helobdella robusta]|uniref:NR LBD domain-containing protein n=1 Tax=Helobdella robusta TaxID=6412 RepID=T1FIJ7_HELRO|nr:hypothetical protein HELRODRAFT_182655 [Helobdella robusta]ESN90247.1 hypothetical protein HELRODRAFT_182655 [Helobdella robusta]
MVFNVGKFESFISSMVKDILAYNNPSKYDEVPEVCRPHPELCQNAIDGKYPYFPANDSSLNCTWFYTCLSGHYMGAIPCNNPDIPARWRRSRFEAWLISAYKAFNSEHLIYTHFCGYTVHLEDMSRLYDDGFLQNVFKAARMLKNLNMTEEEECLLKSIIILFRDRAELVNPDLVESCQLKIIDAVNRFHLRRRPKDRLFVARIISVLVYLRSLSEQHIEQESKINMEWATDIKLPPLLYELFSV